MSTVITKPGETSGRDENETDNEVGALLQQVLPWKENPFLNTLVLERFFELCDSEDLSNFRLVCKLWKSESLTRWNLETEPLEIIRQTTGTPESLTVWKELTDQLKAGRKPHRYFRLLNFDNLEFVPKPPTPSSPPLENDLNSAEKLTELVLNVETFWTTCGPWIQKLELGSCTISSMDSFKKVVFEDTPNLKVLCLNSFKSSNTWSADCEYRGWRTGVLPRYDTWNEHNLLQHLRIKFPFSFPLSWRHLLFHFPNLQTLQLDNIEFTKNSVCGRHAWQEISMICEERKRNRLMFPIIFKNVVFRLNSPVPVSVGRTLTDGLNTIFRDLRPILKHVTLFLKIASWKDEERSLLSEIFWSCAEAMKELIFEVDWVSENGRKPVGQFVNFQLLIGPCCSSIMKLHLKGNACPNLHFLHKFPNLEELRLEITRSDEMLRKTNLARMLNGKLFKLKKFQYFDDCPQVPIPEKVLNLFVTMMRNLEYFEAPLTNSLLRIVCRGNWSQLRELHTDCNKMRDEDKINDQGVTGIVPGGEGERLANITDMQNLEVLSIRNVDLAGDVSIQEGFLKMPHLKSLNVDLGEASDELFDTLVNRFPHSNISRCRQPAPDAFVVVNL